MHFTFPSWCEYIDILDNYTWLLLSSVLWFLSEAVNSAFIKICLMFFSFFFNKQMQCGPISLKISVNACVYYFTTYSLSVLKPYLLLLILLPCVWFYWSNRVSFGNACFFISHSTHPLANLFFLQPFTICIAQIL